MRGPELLSLMRCPALLDPREATAEREREREITIPFASKQTSKQASKQERSGRPRVAERVAKVVSGDLGQAGVWAL